MGVPYTVFARSRPGEPVGHPFAGPSCPGSGESFTAKNNCAPRSGEADRQSLAFGVQDRQKKGGGWEQFAVFRS